jgi:ATP-dependent DNA ligase
MATAKKRKQPPTKAIFIESMECLPVSKLPDGPEWTYEIKLDGFRLEAVKNAGETILYSRRRNILNKKFQYIADALKSLPDATILDGEIVALDADKRSDFGLLQNFRSAETKIYYYAFDMLVTRWMQVMARLQLIDFMGARRDSNSRPPGS